MVAESSPTLHAESPIALVQGPRSIPDGAVNRLGPAFWYYAPPILTPELALAQFSAWLRESYR
jgi:hypothetical protein